MGVEAEAYSQWRLGDKHPSRWPDEKRQALEWHDPWAIPVFLGNESHCRDPYCKDTMWGGFSRVHVRGKDCPAMKNVDYLGKHRQDARETTRCPCHTVFGRTR